MPLQDFFRERSAQSDPTLFVWSSVISTDSVQPISFTQMLHSSTNVRLLCLCPFDGKFCLDFTAQEADYLSASFSSYFADFQYSNKI